MRDRSSRLILYEKPPPSPGSSCMRQDYFRRCALRRAIVCCGEPIYELQSMLDPDRGARIKFRLILGLLAYSIGPAMAAGSSKPDFGPNVLIFNSSMSAATMQERIDKVY